MFRWILAAGIAFLTCGLSGCMDGPFYNLKKANPFYLQQWRKDSSRGPTYEARFREIKSLENQISRLGPTEQEEWALRLEALVKDDPSPEIRRQAVRCAAKITSPTSTRILNIASGDEVEKVRLAACSAWSQRNDAAAKDMLLSLAKQDSSSSVRQSAIAGLKGFNDPEVVRAMAALLDDKSPAVQYNVTQTLAALTGQDHGGDINAWKNVINANSPNSGSPDGTTQPAYSPPVQMAGGENTLPTGINR